MNDTRMPGRAFPQASGPGSVVNPDGTRNAHAVVVGINRYASEQIRDLRYARADAEAVADVFTDPEFGRFPPENVTLLLDEEATQRSVISAIGTGLRRSAKEEDLVCVYFAGHGAVEPDPESSSADGTSKYLMAADTDPNDLFATAVAMDRVQVFFRRIFAKQVIFLLDSCYSGGADTTPFRSGVSNDFLERLGEGEGRLVLTSCSPNELSLERADYGGGHGLFTHHLLGGLKGLADLDGDGLVTLDELYTYVHDRVKDDSRQAGGSMTPIRTGSSTGRIFLTAYQSEEAKKAERLHEAAGAFLEADDLAPARETWEQALKLDPEHTGARDGLEGVRATEGSRTKALVDLNRNDALPDDLLQSGLELLGTPLAGLDETAVYRREKLIDLCRGAIGVATFVQVWRSTIDPASAAPASAREDLRPGPVGRAPGGSVDSAQAPPKSSPRETSVGAVPPGRLVRFMKEKPIVAGLGALAVLAIAGSIGVVALSGGGSPTTTSPTAPPPTSPPTSPAGPGGASAGEQGQITPRVTAPSPGDPGWPVEGRLSFDTGWTSAGTSLPAYPRLEGNEVTLIPSDQRVAASAVLYGGDLTPPYQLEFEYLTSDEGAGGLIVMVQKDGAVYDGNRGDGGFIYDGSGYAVHFTGAGAGLIMITDGDGQVLAEVAHDTYPGHVWRQAFVVVEANRIVGQIDGRQVQASGPVVTTSGTLGFSAATGGANGEHRVRNVRVVPMP